jgi:hypothetical protein
MRHAGYHRVVVAVLMAVCNTVILDYLCALSTYVELRIATNKEQARYS